MISRLYLVGAILGLLLPYAAFVPFLVENGLDLALFAELMSIAIPVPQNTLWCT